MGMEEGREEEEEGMVVDKGVVGSGVAVRGQSGQCGMVEGMEQGVVVVEEGVQGGSGEHTRERVIQSRKEEEKAWEQEGDLVG